MKSLGRICDNRKLQYLHHEIHAKRGGKFENESRSRDRQGVVSRYGAPHPPAATLPHLLRLVRVSMSVDLTDAEARVLGALIEKDMTTPDHYPLSLNALVNACNQKSSRDPIVNYDERIVRETIGKLQAKKLAVILTGRDHRVPKYRHWAWETLALGNREMALLCVLMLRGPQTTGELKGRTERMYQFDGLESVESCLQRLMDREAGALTAKLPRQPGSRESRYVQLLSGEASVEPAAAPASPPPPIAGGTSRDERIASLEARVASLEDKIDNFGIMFDEFKKQFE